MTQVLVIGYVWPESGSSAAGARMLQLLEYFLPHARISFATTASPTPFMDTLEERGIQTANIELNNSSFDEYLLQLQPDIVLFDRFMMEEQFGWRVARHCPKALRILDTEDLHFLRQYREKSFKTEGDIPCLKQSEVAKREIASIFRCDLSLIISEEEMALLQTEFSVPAQLLFYLPFLYDTITAKDIEQLPAYDVRKNFISVGNFKHAPNVDAVIYLKEKIWPLIHSAIPEAKMLICGAYPSNRIEQLHAPKDNFLIKGRVESAQIEVKKARIVLAPLRFGAGLKGKLTEAMLCGTPSITTTVGAEGMRGSLPWNGEIQDDPGEFAQAAVNLYSNSTPWEIAKNNGIQIINSRFSKEIFYKVFKDRLLALNQNKESHRIENFTGAMLMHHRTRSTYFLSKYIELKTELEKLKLSQK